MQLTRRHVLAATGAMAAAAVVGTGTMAIRWWDRAPGEGLLALAPDEAELVASAAEAWMPPGGTPAISGRDAGCAAFVDEVVSRMPGTQRVLFKVLLQAIDELPVVTEFSTFTALPLARRTELIDHWMNRGPWAQRQTVGALMALIAFGYTLHPDVAPVFRRGYRCGYGP